ncbi:acetylhydrolase [Saccharothrix sp. NRRL B-16348]|uniref:alpha/beta hydrolase family protein n=1 Tax=Saccharothrix sp. NRRL B-16348 TaxID=1415542 RepID=UPI0003C96166|nr:acetylhydrolase [Saccharothrix sp. NRRL B-16348]AGZ94312.1 lipase [Saccharothrix sp. NRRL B-16348]KOX18622.1 acetylhydrolase [Saccharothrix sp. NRRL B-16348]
MRGLTFLIALTLVLSATPASASEPEPSDATPYLPAPTGRHPVGTTSLHLTDTSRLDPWVPTTDRELMVSLFYPAASARGPKKQFMTLAESAAVLEEAGITTVPPDVLSTVRTNAVVDARPAGRRHGLPLVVLSPGFKRPRATLTSLAEDLASHGYVVVVVDHTYENVATTFPDGRVAPCAACGKYDIPFWVKLGEGRAADVSFVLDQLTGPLRHRPGANLVDASRIAMGGHSVGGVSSLVAARADQRIRAAIDVDGSIITLGTEPELSRPVMLLGRQNAYEPGAPGGSADTWQEHWPSLTGWKRWLVVAGMEHPSFTDLGVVAGQLGLDFGEVGWERGAAITRAYVRAFFDLHLRGEPQPLLDRPSARYPEVSIVESSS